MNMPDRKIHTICDLIYFRYALIIAYSAFSVVDRQKAKKLLYGFIKDTFWYFML